MREKPYETDEWVTIAEARRHRYIYVPILTEMKNNTYPHGPRNKALTLDILAGEAIHRVASRYGLSRDYTHGLALSVLRNAVLQHQNKRPPAAQPQPPAAQPQPLPWSVRFAALKARHGWPKHRATLTIIRGDAP